MSDSESSTPKVGMDQTTLAASRRVESSDSSEMLLIVMSGKDVGNIFQLRTTQAIYLIGREENADIQILDGEISRRHAVIRYDASGDHFLITDLGSRNGTRVNDKSTKGEEPLKPGDKVKLGTHTVLRVSHGSEAEARYARKMYQAVLRDALTGVFNRRYLDDRLSGEIAFAVRHDEPLCLMLLDIDHFKKINDTYGHQGGDVALKNFASLLQTELRAEDVVARYGGEEFAILARQTDEERGTALAERLRDTVARALIEFEGETIEMTVSIGVATTGAITSVNKLIEAADRALYAAKTAGRNRVHTFSDLPEAD